MWWLLPPGIFKILKNENSSVSGAHFPHHSQRTWWQTVAYKIRGLAFRGNRIHAYFAIVAQMTNIYIRRLCGRFRDETWMKIINAPYSIDKKSWQLQNILDENELQPIPRANWYEIYSLCEIGHTLTFCISLINDIAIQDMKYHLYFPNRMVLCGTISHPTNEDVIYNDIARIIDIKIIERQ